MFEFIKKLFGIKQEEIAVVEETAKKVVKRVKKVADVNNDNIVNLEDVKEVKRRVTKKVKEVADLNKDGKVDLADVSTAVKKVTKKTKVVDPVVEPPLPKKRGRKPKAK
jgi:hypothetical protein